MLFHYIVILAVIQGLTEFIPVSSSGHLVLVHALMGQERGTSVELKLDVAVHVGTLFSALIYFRKDILNMIRGMIRLTFQRKSSGDSRLALFVLLASLPVIAIGLALHVLGPEFLRRLDILAWSSIGFGVLLWAADSFRPKARTLETMRLKDALFIGIAQALALIPGASRSGMTMTAGRWLGFSRVEAARFSLLLSVVAISGAGLLEGQALIQSGDRALGAEVFAAALLAFLSGWVAIALMMRWLRHMSFTPFVLYRITLGILLLALIHLGFLNV